MFHHSLVFGYRVRDITSMHRALSITEIRYLICTVAIDHTLVQLAQCCRNFHEPAIRALWSTVPDISPLVRCFPQDAWTLVPNPRGGNSIVSMTVFNQALIAHVSGFLETCAVSSPTGLDKVPQVFQLSAKTRDASVFQVKRPSRWPVPKA